MTDLFETQMNTKAIHNPKYFEDAECLKQVNVFEKEHYYQLINNYFKHSRAKWLYCKLAIWGDDEWMLYFAPTHGWPLEKDPYPELLEEGYRASKNRGCHMFNLIDGRPWDKQQRVA